jgi:FixJ family two-component response regulator
MSAAESTVFVVDDEPSVRKSLGRLLKAAGYRVEAFASAREFLQRDPDFGVSCLVLDMQMPELNGLELQQALMETDRSLPIIFITGHGDIPMSVHAMKAGALDFLSKPFDEKDLLGAIARALEKARHQSKHRAESAEIKQLLATLTPREHDVLLQVITGRPNKQIAAALGTSEKTVKVHRGRVMHKMQVQSVADLVRLCEKAGIRVP